MNPDYKQGYDILMEYFDCIPEDERKNVSEQLEAVGL